MTFHRLPHELLGIEPLLEWYDALLARLDGPAALKHRTLAARRRMHRLTGLEITDHLIERFCERWRPYAARDEARAALLELLCTAAPTPNETWASDGAEPWMAGPLRLIVREMRVVTVLPMERL